MPLDMTPAVIAEGTPDPSDIILEVADTWMVSLEIYEIVRGRTGVSNSSLRRRLMALKDRGSIIYVIIHGVPNYKRRDA